MFTDNGERGGSMTEKTAGLLAAAEKEREERLNKHIQFAEDKLKKAGEYLNSCKEDLQLFYSLQIDPGTDDIETQIAKQYIKVYRAELVSVWAYETIPGYARTKEEARERTREILDSFRRKQGGIFKAAAIMRDNGKERAQNMMI